MNFHIYIIYIYIYIKYLDIYMYLCVDVYYMYNVLSKTYLFIYLFMYFESTFHALHLNSILLGASVNSTLSHQELHRTWHPIGRKSLLLLRNGSGRLRGEVTGHPFNRSSMTCRISLGFDGISQGPWILWVNIFEML